MHGRPWRQAGEAGLVQSTLGGSGFEKVIPELRSVEEPKGRSLEGNRKLGAPGRVAHGQTREPWLGISKHLAIGGQKEEGETVPGPCEHPRPLSPGAETALAALRASFSVSPELPPRGRARPVSVYEVRAPRSQHRLTACPALSMPAQPGRP